MSYRARHVARRRHLPVLVPFRRTIAASAASLLAASAAVAGLVVTAAPASADVIAPFTVAFHAQDNGQTQLVGNTLMSCPASASGCANARAGTGNPNNLDDNDWNMAFVDADSDPTTVSSSSSDLTMPSGSTVLFAKLYWGARLTAGAGGSVASGNPQQMRFRVAGASSYQTIAATTYSQSPNTGTLASAYQSSADVTNIVRAAGNGTYWGANVAAGTGADRYAGWTVVVVFSNPSLPLRDLTVFNGFASVEGAQTQNLTVNGFVSPPSGTVRSRIGVVDYEGDLGITGDQLLLNGSAMSDAVSPSTNFFNSTNDYVGTNVTTRNPAYPNQLGYDVKYLATPGVINNGDTSATLTLKTNGDTYFPGAVVFSVDLYAPNFPGVTKTVTDLSGKSPAAPGDTLQYTLAYTNTGEDAADATVASDPLPANVTYVPGSLRVTAGANTGVKTDASGDDQAEYDAANRLVRFRLGTGATASTGGTLAPNASTTATFQVTLDRASAGTTVNNTAQLDYRAHTIAKNFTFTGNTVSTPVSELADLSLSKSAAPEPVRAGTDLTYTLNVGNAGPSPATGTSVTDTLPSGVGFVSATPSTGGCTRSGPTVTCTLGAVAIGASPTVTIVVGVPADAPIGSLTNTASVQATTADPDLTNNTAGATSTVRTRADVTLTKTAAPGAVVPGGQVTYTLAATDNGPSDAAGVTISDALPAGLTYVSSSIDRGSCTASTGVVTCAVGALANGATATATITARLDPSYSGGPISNTANETATTTDPTPGDNSATATSQIAAASADLAVTKTALSSAVAGQPLSWRIGVANNGPSDAQGVTLSDPLPSGTTLVSANPRVGTCDQTGPTVNCTLGTIPAGANVTTIVTVNVDAGRTGNLVNTATAAADSDDPTPGNNSATSTTPVDTSADLQLTKTGTPNPLTAGDDETYTISVADNGPSDAAGVTVTDEIPAPLVFVSADASQGSCTESDGAVTCALGTVANSANATVTVVAHAPSGSSPDNVTNTAGVTASTNDPDPSNNSASYAISTNAQADLSLTKSADPDPVTAGNQVTYTLIAHNDGPSDAAGVAVTDPLPAGVVFVSATFEGGSCTNTNDTVTCTAETLAAGNSATMTIVATLGSAVPAGPLPNTASIAASGPDDPTTSNNSATFTSTVLTRADVSITDSVTPSPVNAGDQVTYTLHMHNNGPSDASLTVADDLQPVGVSFVSGTFTGGTCTGNGGLVNCRLGAVPAGGDVVITIVARVDPSTPPGSLSDAATVSSAVSDPDLSNNSASATFDVVRSSDLSMTKSAAPATFVAGMRATYTLSVANAGPSDSADATVTDPIPASLALVAATTTLGTCTSGATVSCDLGSVPAGDTATVTIAVRVPAGGTGSITNSASVSSASDPAGGNNNDSTTNPVTASADISVVKTAADNPVTAGTGTIYTLAVTNAGPSDATAASVTDELPNGATLLSASPSQGSCGPVDGSGAITCDLGTLPSGTTTTVVLAVTFDADLTGNTITNSATASSATPDPDETNNTATLQSDLTTSADVSVAKTALPTTIVPGDPFRYRITVSNRGPSDARNVVVTDDLPSGIIATDATSTQGSCDIAGSTVTCSLGDITAGDIVVQIVGVELPASSQLTGVSNTVSVQSDTPDPNPGNNSFVRVSPVQASADLSIMKTATPSAAIAGDQLTYTLTVANAGPSDASAATVTDPLPGPVSFVSADATQGTCTQIGGTVSCQLGRVAAGTDATVTVVVNLSAAFGGNSITNTASVLSPDQDPDTTNNAATLTTPVVQSADLSITGSGTPSPATPGGPITYSLTVHNGGPSGAAGVTVADDLPSSITNATVTTSAGTCTIGAGGMLTCDLGALPAGGDDVTVTVTGTIDPSATGSITNTATVDSATPDPDPANNETTIDTPLIGSADVSITKSVTPAVPTAGDPATYTLTVHNAGPSDAADVTVTDPIQGDQNIGSPTASSGSCAVAGQTVTCALGTVAAGDDETITIPVRFSASYPAGSYSNTATVTSSTADPGPSNNAAGVSGATAAQADLSVTKTADPSPVTAGGPITYTITVHNDGPSDATDTVVTDVVPTAVTVTATTPAGCSGTATVTCDLGTVPAGSDRTVTITGTLDPAAAGSVANTAAVASTAADPAPGDNSDTVTTPIVASADLAIAKTIAPAAPTPGSTATYTLHVTNAGPSTAVAVTVTDALQPDQTIGAVTTSAGSCDVSGRTVTCAVGSVAPGDDVTIQIPVTFSASYTTGTFANTAAVTTGTPDPDPANNTASISGPNAPQADLVVTKQADPAFPAPGAVITWAVAVHNNGPSDAHSVQVVDTPPTDVSVTTVATSQGSCATGSSPLTCDLGTVASGDSATATITATIATTATGSLVNEASAVSTTADPDSTDNTDSVTTPLVPSADLSITKTVMPAHPVPGKGITYQLVVRNHGPSNATRVVMTDRLAAGQRNPHVTTSRGTCTGTRTIACQVGTLAPDASARMTIRVALGAGFTGKLVNTATVRSSTSDPNSDNNSASVHPATAPSADLSVTKRVDRRRPHVGDRVQYTVRLVNHGPSDAKSIVVTDRLPKGLRYRSAKAGVGRYVAPTGRWTLPRLAASATAQLVVRARVTKAGRWTNVATVTKSGTHDPVRRNNSARVSVTAHRKSAASGAPTTRPPSTRPPSSSPRPSGSAAPTAVSSRPSSGSGSTSTSSSSGLPVTGADVLGLTGLAVLLVVGGFAVLRIGRRRSH